MFLRIYCALLANGLKRRTQALNSKKADRRRAALQRLLRKVRLEQRLTQQEVAARLLVPQSVISKYESGERRLDMIELHAVAEAIGVPFADIVARYLKSA